MLEGVIFATRAKHTDNTIHGLGPRLLECASPAILSYSLPMPVGALVGPGRAKGALMSSLSAGDSFDMAVVVTLMIVEIVSGLLQVFLSRRGMQLKAVVRPQCFQGCHPTNEPVQ